VAREGHEHHTGPPAPAPGDGGNGCNAVANRAGTDDRLPRPGYETLSLRPNERGYHEEVRRLVERVDMLMRMAETDSLDVAVETEVRRYQPPRTTG
jgi:hypothetical protein